MAKQHKVTALRRRSIDIAGWVTASRGGPFAFPISIRRTKAAVETERGSEGDRYNVVYGNQTMADLDYRRAAYELGRSIMHALYCDGAFDG